MRIALDTNVLAYAEGINGAIRRDRILETIRRLPPEAVVLPAQALGELFNVLVRKARRRPARAREAVLSWRDAYAAVDTSAAIIVNASDHWAGKRVCCRLAFDRSIEPRVYPTIFSAGCWMLWCPLAQKEPELKQAKRLLQQAPRMAISTPPRLPERG